jgi:hypothetical protein
MKSLDLERSIIPIVHRDAGGSVTGLLGTGFVVGSRHVVVTAAHVFKSQPLAEGENYAAAFVAESGSLKLVNIRTPLAHPVHDIAIFRAESIPGTVPLSIAAKRVPLNHDVLTYEYSSTTITRDASGKKIVNFSPFTHKGNVMRHYLSTFPELQPTPVMDTSFPALQGASGAPVVRNSDFAVVGMLVANHERHLVPAQVVRIDGQTNEVEETRYFLPIGKALEAELILEFLTSIDGIDPQVV